jgi:hypothetical protein
VSAPIFDQAAEDATLGAMMLTAAACDVGAATLNAEDFYRDTERRIFAAALALRADGQKVDPVTVGSRLGADADLKARLHSLTDACPAAGNVAGYIGAVRRDADRRRLGGAVKAMQTIAAENGLAPDVLHRRFSDLLAAAQPREAAAEDLLVWAKDVETKDTDWLWARRIPRGMVTILFGEPGGGKTHVGLDIVTRVSLGSAMPDGSRAPLGNCMVLSGEDDWATTLRPRLEYAGADLDRVAFFPAIAAFGSGERRTFRLTTDAVALERNLRHARAVFLKVDPLTCFLDRVDTHRDADVRVALSILADVARRTGVAVLCVLHPNKADKQGISALNRLSGSGAFGAAARSVMAVVPDPQAESEERRLLLPVKLNIAAQPHGLGFRIVSNSPTTCKSGIVWDTDPVESDADEAFGVVRADTPQMTKAKAFLKRVLGAGEPYPATLAQEEALAEGINPKTLQRAKKKLRIVSKLEGFGSDGVWTWKLGEPEDGGS